MRRFILFVALGACLAQEDRAKEFIDLLAKGDFAKPPGAASGTAAAADRIAG